MIGLVRSEALRFVSRRLFRVVGALIFLGVLVSAVIVFVQASSDPDPGLEAARRDVAECRRFEEQAKAADPGFAEGQFVCPSVADLQAAYDRRFHYARTMPDATRAVAVVMLVVSLVVGASFVGAEWGTGALATWLTWEPRRARVLLAKVIAGVACVAITTVAVLVFLDLVYLPVAAARGTTSGAGALWDTLAGIWARGAGLAAFGAVLGMGLAMLARNTAGAIVIGLVYGAIVDPLLGAWRFGRYRPWLLQHNLPRLLGWPAPGREEPGGFGNPQLVLSVTRPIVLFSIYATGLLLLAYASFRARDIT